MKKAFAILLITTLAGCASNQAILPSLEGKPRIKINTQQNTIPVFDFVFQGDILDGLAKLNVLQPQMEVLKPIGKPFPFHVSVNLQSTTMESVLRTMGEQGGKEFDLILNMPQAEGGYQVRIRFNNQEH